MRSTQEVVNGLRTVPGTWTDAAIVVAFHNRFELVAEDHPCAADRLRFLEEQGGFAIGFAGVQNASTGSAFVSKLFPEYEEQGWAHRSMAELRKIVQRQSPNMFLDTPARRIGAEEF